MRLFFACFILITAQTLSAQNSIIDFFENTGKIYAVVACIVVIFIGIVLFLIRIDRKLSKLEQHIKDE